MKEKNFSITNRLNSFSHAFFGLKTLFKEEHNARIHLLAAILVFTLGGYLELSTNEWYIVIILIAFVFTMELINSAIENISDLVSPEKNDFIKKAKDQAAAAVLISAIVSLIIGGSIFIPKILELFDTI